MLCPRDRLPANDDHCPQLSTKIGALIGRRCNFAKAFGSALQFQLHGFAPIARRSDSVAKETRANLKMRDIATLQRRYVNKHVLFAVITGHESVAFGMVEEFGGQ